MERACIRNSSGGPSVRVGGNLFSMAAGRGGRVRESRSNKISSITLSCISLSAPSALRLASSNKSIMIGNQGCGLMHVCLAWRSTLVKLSTTTPSPFTSWIIIPPSSCQRPSFNPIRTVFSWNETWNTFARKDGFQSILPTQSQVHQTMYQLPLLGAVHRHPPIRQIDFREYAIARQPARNDCFGASGEEALRCRRSPARPISSATAATRAHRRRADANCLPNSRRGRKAASRSRQAVSSSSRCDTPAKSGRPDFSIPDGVRGRMPIAESDSRPFG